MDNFFVAILTVIQVLGTFLLFPIMIALIIISLVFTLGKFQRKITGSIKESIEVLVCSIDADCPEGYLCIGGKCVPQN